MATVSAPSITNKTSPNKSKYRPEIDGLRAFAVVAVIINHFNKNLLPSGYLGVDIFFVISGYVITSSLAGRESKNFLDFLTGFYVRRIKRLVPALVVFVLITSVLICLFNPDPTLALITGGTSLVGLSNLYLLNQSTDYFAQSTELNPFTNTWSLGVEEQFYLLFPFLIWFSGFGRQKDKGARNLFLLVGSLTIASLISFIYLYQINQPAAYFLMPPRFWEMAAGCLIFIGFQRRARVEQALEQVPPLLVMLAMVGVMFLPIGAAVPATISIVLLSAVLIACLKKGTMTYHFFTLEKVVYVGLISYSLYLWHWSVLSISRWTLGIHWWSVFLQVPAMFFIAYLSHKYIESPLRKTRHIQSIQTAIGAALLTTSVNASIIFLLNHKSANVFQFANPQVRLIEKRLDNGKVYRSLILKDSDSWQKWGQAAGIKKTKGCHKSDLIRESDLSKCLGIDKSDGFKSRIYVIGDSHASAYAPGLTNAFPDAAVRTYTVGWGCAYLPRSTAAHISRIKNFNCNDYIANIDTFVSNDIRPKDMVVLSMDWRDGAGKKNSPGLGNAVASLAERIVSQGAYFILLDDVPALGDPLLCQKTWYRPSPLSSCVKTIREVATDQSSLDAIGRMITSASQTNTKYINLRQEFCDKRGICSIYLDGVQIFRDDGHITENAAVRYASKVLKSELASLMR
ncbi:acyltransferase [Synechococcus sp. CB0101]|uniref:acyltransferase family protein n=1 Tax=Synechococcus sp. CB0101 TaxID=232348 RepID=UPI0002002CDB|nr:acyltransferase family protein [Synechococcus sp. CB0101]QCH15298.1 acyltransferase [Synechococcus sp. CB0101]